MTARPLAAIACALLLAACAKPPAPAPMATAEAKPASAPAPKPAAEAPSKPAKPVADAPRVVFLTSDGDVPVKVELALTPSQRSRGLMNREHLADGDGMAFVFGRRARQSFWMKNTLIPLDMIFVDGSVRGGDLRVVGVVHEAEPHTLTPRAVEAPSHLVVEVPGGWSRRHGIDTGTLLRVEGFALPRTASPQEN